MKTTMKLGEKIRFLRKQHGMSQEYLAEKLGVSFQAISKWETGLSLPDVALIPAIASFFCVTTDDLFDFDLYEINKKVDGIVDEWHELFVKENNPSNLEECEKLLRKALKEYPGNDVLLNCLMCTLPLPDKANEVIEIGRQIVGSTQSDVLRIDAYRLMAESYKSIGDYSMCKQCIEKIPEIYYSCLYIKAILLDGEERFEAANKEKCLSFEHLIKMLCVLSEHYENNGDKEKAILQLQIAINVIRAFEEDSPTEYTKSVYDDSMIEEIAKKINRFSDLKK